MRFILRHNVFCADTDTDRLNLISQCKPLNDLGRIFLGGKGVKYQHHNVTTLTKVMQVCFFHICVSIDVDAVMRKSHPLLRTEPFSLFLFFFFLRLYYTGLPSCWDS